VTRISTGKTMLFAGAGVHLFRRARRRAAGLARVSLLDAEQPPTPTDLNVAMVRAAAAELGIEVTSLPGGFLELTRGDATQFSRGSDFAFEPLVPWFMCGDKRMTSTLLAERGLPVPAFASFSIAEYDAAVEFFRGHSEPVVVKPARGTSGGDGVTIGVRTERGFRAAFARALAWKPEVLVESQVPGHHLRVTILEGEVLGVVRRIPAHVVGDGRSSVRALVATKNSMWQKGSPSNRLFRPIRLDAEVRRVLGEGGRALDSVPATGEVVYLRRVSNADQGGEVEDVRDAVHPGHARLALAAAAVMGPVLCGADLIVRDLSRPPAEGNVVINEINTTPALYVANEMVGGRPSTYAAEMILRRLFALDA
jgi:cyanophycin synthetase